MTFQPPPPPPGETPPPPPPAGGYPPPQGSGYPAPQGAAYPAPPNRFDPKAVNPLDWAIVGLGALILIFSFFEYYHVDLGPFGSDGAGAWHWSHGSFVAWFGMFFAVLGAAAVALELFAPQVDLPWPKRLVAVTLLGLGSLFYILAIFIHPKFYDERGLSFGHGFSFWLSLVMCLAATVCALMRLQQTGGRLPGALGNLPDIGNRAGIPGAATAPGASATPSQPAGPAPGAPPPPQEYQPPQPGYGPPPQ
jgi:hypothetical protein